MPTVKNPLVVAPVTRNNQLDRELMHKQLPHDISGRDVSPPKRYDKIRYTGTPKHRHNRQLFMGEPASSVEFSDCSAGAGATGIRLVQIRAGVAESLFHSAGDASECRDDGAGLRFALDVSAGVFRESHARFAALASETRIGPNTVSFYSIDIYDVVYGAGSRYRRDPQMYGGFVQGCPALFSITMDHLRDLMLGEIDHFVTVMKKRNDQIVNASTACRSFEADIIWLIEAWNLLERVMFQLTGWRTRYSSCMEQWSLVCLGCLMSVAIINANGTISGHDVVNPCTHPVRTIPQPELPTKAARRTSQSRIPHRYDEPRVWPETDGLRQGRNPLGGCSIRYATQTRASRGRGVSRSIPSRRNYHHFLAGLVPSRPQGVPRSDVLQSLSVADRQWLSPQQRRSFTRSILHSVFQGVKFLYRHAVSKDLFLTTAVDPSSQTHLLLSFACYEIYLALSQILKHFHIGRPRSIVLGLKGDSEKPQCTPFRLPRRREWVTAVPNEALNITLEPLDDSSLSCRVESG
nr:hypothetical protein CFP56_42142 [Quercus suber]